MGRGGARVRSGPPADPHALRRERDGMQFVSLPPAGRSRPAPRWPLSPAATSRERRVWRHLWTKPQAVEWERLGLEIEVGLYVRTLAAAERPDAGPTLLAERRRQADALGLTASGLKAHRWLVAPEQQAASTADLTATGTEGAPAKSRWKVLDGGS